MILWGRSNAVGLGIGVVGPSLDTPPQKAKYPGTSHPHANPSCKDLGLDVKIWIDQELVDYVCPLLFWPFLPGLPHTQE